ncbi:MAG TPA: hypothetical protein VIL74_20635 [Pyrinomonadaceae bacterium]|jgi:hypothetical protein
MAKKTEKVKVKLAAACYVGGKLRAEGDVVEVKKEIAKEFGEIVKEPKSDAPKDK